MRHCKTLDSAQKETAGLGVGAQNGGKVLAERTGKSTRPGQCRTAPPVARYIRWPVYNDDHHLIGFELLKIGPGLDRYLTQLAEESGR